MNIIHDDGNFFRISDATSIPFLLPGSKLLFLYQNKVKLDKIEVDILRNEIKHCIGYFIKF
jgi:hypothetical protein